MKLISTVNYLLRTSEKDLLPSESGKLEPDNLPKARCFGWNASDKLLFDLSAGDVERRAGLRRGRVSGRCVGMGIRIELVSSGKAGLVRSLTVWCELDFVGGLGCDGCSVHLDGQMHLHQAIGKFHGSVEGLFHSGLGD